MRCEHGHQRTKAVWRSPTLVDEGGAPSSGSTTSRFSKHLVQFAIAYRQISLFHLDDRALAKVEGDVFELMEAGAIWNAFAVWNQFMDGNGWISKAFTQPTGAVATPSRKAAILKLPRVYDTTKLFKPEVRSRIQAHESALKLRGMELGVSSPDIVGIRIPDPMPVAFGPFLKPLTNLGEVARTLLENMHQHLEGTLEGRSLLFAVAVKRTTRSDRLYQPLFEANVLKYLIEEVLRALLSGSTFTWARLKVRTFLADTAPPHSYHSCAGANHRRRSHQPCTRSDPVTRLR